jgi:hypothetical protein
MASIYDWSKTAASNANSDSGINWAENQDPGTVNDSARAMMGRDAEWRDDLIGIVTVGGSANAITITTNSAFTTLADGRRFTFKASADNSGATTINANGTGAKSVRVFNTSGEAACSGGEIKNGCLYEVIYLSALNGAAGGWLLLNPGLAGLTTSGTWTPGINFGGGNTGVTYTSRSASYIRIGNIVFFKLSIVLSNKGSGGGSLTIDTFPFTATSVACPLKIIATNMTGLSFSMDAEMASSGDSILVYTWSSTGVTALTETKVTNTSTFRVSGAVFI